MPVVYDFKIIFLLPGYDYIIVVKPYFCKIRFIFPEKAGKIVADIIPFPSPEFLLEKGIPQPPGNAEIQFVGKEEVQRPSALSRRVFLKPSEKAPANLLSRLRMHGVHGIWLLLCIDDDDRGILHPRERGFIPQSFRADSPHPLICYDMGGQHAVRKVPALQPSPFDSHALLPQQPACHIREGGKDFVRIPSLARASKRVVRQADRNPFLLPFTKEPLEQFPPFVRKQCRIAFQRQSVGIPSAEAMRIVYLQSADSMSPHLFQMPADPFSGKLISHPPVERHHAVSPGRFLESRFQSAVSLSCSLHPQLPFCLAHPQGPCPSPRAMPVPSRAVSFSPGPCPSPSGPCPSLQGRVLSSRACPFLQNRVLSPRAMPVLQSAI